MSPPVPSRALSVLVVEDHDDTARMLQRMLKLSGYRVSTAPSVAQALQLAAAEPFDLVVSDVGLPDATGYELMRQLRQAYSMRGIALSGHNLDEDLEMSRQAGFNAHLVKPISFSDLEQTIRRITST